jgi:hypothetical protein
VRPKGSGERPSDGRSRDAKNHILAALEAEHFSELDGLRGCLLAISEIVERNGWRGDSE